MRERQRANDKKTHFLCQRTELQQIIRLRDKCCARIHIAADDRSATADKKRTKYTCQDTIPIGNKHLFSTSEKKPRCVMEQRRIGFNSARTWLFDSHSTLERNL